MISGEHVPDRSLAPKATSQEIVLRLQREVNETLRSDSMSKLISDRGSTSSPSTGHEFDAFLASQIKKWGKAVALSGASAD